MSLFPQRSIDHRPIRVYRQSSSGLAANPTVTLRYRCFVPDVRCAVMTDAYFDGDNPPFGPKFTILKPFDFLNPYSIELDFADFAS